MCCGHKCCLWFTYIATISLVLATLIVTFVFLRQDLKFTVTDASLKQFDISSTDNSTLFYDLALNITIRNPNKKVGMFFDGIQVISNYRKKRFARTTLNSTTPFYLGHKNTTVLSSVVLQGQQTLSFKEGDLEKYNSERSSGVFSIDVKLAIQARARYGKIKIPSYSPSNKIHCDKLKVSLVDPNATSSLKFKAIKCKIDMIVLPPP